MPSKKCPKGKILNPTTSRCVKADGKIGQSIKTKPNSKRTSSQKQNLKESSSSKKHQSKSTTKTELSIMTMITAVIPLLKAQPKLSLSLNFGKKTKSDEWYDDEIRIRFKDNAFHAKQFEHDKWRRLSQEGMSESQLLKFATSFKIKQLVLTADRLKKQIEPKPSLIFWRQSS